jgi:hypothetical protein
MEVSCEKCRTRFTIPDEKVPKGRVMKLTCPKCMGGITLGSEALSPAPEHKEETKGEDFRLRFIEAKASKRSAEESYSYEDYTGDQSLEFFEEGTRLALVMADSREHSDMIRGAVEKILAEGFDGQPLDHSAILNYLNRLPMSVRRRVFLGLISDGFKTMDNMMAFAMSANVVINIKDTEKLHLVLRKAIAENEMFYKVFTDALVEAGKI